MKFSCTKDNVLRALTLTNGIPSKNINLPILSNVLIRVEEQKVDFITTNLEMAVVVTVRSKIETVGSFTVPARTISEFVNLLSADKILFDVHDNELEINGGKSNTKIKGTSAEEFPIIPTVENGKEFMVNAELLSEGLEQVLPAVAKIDIRPELSGVLFAFNVGGSGLTLAATDSYRLAEKKIPLHQGKELMRVIVPGRTAQEIYRALSAPANHDNSSEQNAYLLVGDGQLVVNYRNIHIISRLVTGDYPDYTQIIPKNFSSTVQVSTVELTKELRAAGLFTTSGVNAISVEISPSTTSLLLASSSVQTGEYRSELPAKIQGVDNKMVLNHRYVLDGLAHIRTGTTEIKVVNSESPCVMSPEGEDKFIYIIMPIKQ